MANQGWSAGKNNNVKHALSFLRVVCFFFWLIKEYRIDMYSIQSKIGGLCDRMSLIFLQLGQRETSRS